MLPTIYLPSPVVRPCTFTIQEGCGDNTTFCSVLNSNLQLGKFCHLNTAWPWRLHVQRSTCCE